MTFEVISGLQSDFAATWAARTPVLFSGSTVPQPGRGEWVRLTIRLASAYQREVGRGSVKIYFPGVLIFQCFCEISVGDGPAIRNADSIAEIYLTKELEFINSFSIPSVDNVGETPDGKWYQVNCNVDYLAVENVTR